MSQVAIKKVNDTAKGTPAIFDEMAKRFQEVERRAFDLFEKRGREFGHELEDWLNAEHEVLGWPAGELAEKDGSYEMRISLPGFEAKEVEVTAAPNEIVVHAATKEEKKEEKPTCYGPSLAPMMFTGASRCRIRSMWTKSLPISRTDSCGSKPPKSRSANKLRPKQLSFWKMAKEEGVCVSPLQALIEC